MGQKSQNCGAKCEGESTDLRVCAEHACPVDCRWSAWGTWTECTKTCGGGTRQGVRKIELEAKNGGVPCTGSTKRTVACNTQSCPVDCKWGEFGEWGGCTQTCGEGIQTRTRKMIKFAKPTANGVITVFGVSVAKLVEEELSQDQDM